MGNFRIWREVRKIEQSIGKSEYQACNISLFGHFDCSKQIYFAPGTPV